MKQVFVVLLVIFGISTVQSVGHNDTFGVIHAIPLEKLEDVFQTHVKTDKGFQAALTYFQGNEWKGLVKEVLDSKEYADFAKLANKFHFNITQALECIRKHIDSSRVPKTDSKPDLSAFLDDFKQALPIGEILGAVMQNKDAIKRIHEEIGKEGQITFEALYKLPSIVKIVEILKSMNFDIQPYLALLNAFLGWTD